MASTSARRVYRTWVGDSRRWDEYAPRDDDIVIATYPKSGTTWMQQIVGSLIFKSAEPMPMAKLGPWLDRRTAPIDDVTAFLSDQTHRRFIKSHMPLDGMPYYDNVKYIHVARDGRDACLSYHHHCRGYTDSAITGLDAIGLADEMLGASFPRPSADPAEFFRCWMSNGIGSETDGLPWLSWFNFEDTYWKSRHLPNVLLVHYRDLKADLEGEMRRVAKFLDIEVPTSLWPSLVKAASFGEMKKVGNVIHPGLKGQFNGDAEHFFAKGENDRWHGVLSANDISNFEVTCRKRLEPACSRWLALGHLGAGVPVE